MNWAGFLHADTNSGKLKVTLIDCGEGGQECMEPFKSKDSKLCCVSRMNKWIELTFVHADSNVIIFGCGVFDY